MTTPVLILVCFVLLATPAATLLGVAAGALFAWRILRGQPPVALSFGRVKPVPEEEPQKPAVRIPSVRS